MIPSTRKEQCLIFHDLARKFRLNNRFVSSAFGTKLSLAESHFLFELDAMPSLGPTELSKIMLLEKVPLSRLISGLEKKRLIKSAAHPDDKRKKLLLITKAGTRVIEKMDIAANEFLRKCSDNLGKADMDTFHRLVKIMCDGYGAPLSNARKGEHPLRVEIRRLTREYGLHTQNVFYTSEVNSLEWFVLEEIGSRENSVTASDLCSLLQVPANTMSDALKRLEKKGFIAKQNGKAPGDKRRIPLVLSPAGSRLVEKTKEKACEDLISATVSFTDHEISELNRIFSAFLRASSPAASALLQPRISIKALISEEERKTGRKFFIEAMVRAGGLDMIGEKLFADTSFCRALLREDSIEAVAEVQVNPDGSGLLTNFAAGPGTDDELMKLFIQSVVQQFSDEVPGAKLTLDRGSLPEHLFPTSFSGY